MAPEQTGRMNRSVDARSDLYALGVTLYQMATGVLPFEAADAMELVHCHIARRPVPPAERAPGVPAAVSAVVMKLLAKTPEDRYQTAAGVNDDLRRCLTLHRRGVSIEHFSLAVHDVPDVLRIPETLYGRERSIQELVAAFERVASEGSTELVLVSGYSGIGKSSIVNELQQDAESVEGHLRRGKVRSIHPRYPVRDPRPGIARPRADDPAQQRSRARALARFHRLRRGSKRPAHHRVSFPNWSW